MYPVLFRVGHLAISTYGVIVALAVRAGGRLAARNFAESGRDPEIAWALLWYAIIGGFVGARCLGPWHSSRHTQIPAEEQWTG